MGEDQAKMKMAEELRLKGNEAYGRRIFEEAIKFYTLSIQQMPSSVCLSNRAQAYIELGRFSFAYVDATEALRLDPNNEKAKMRRDKALECMGMGQERQKTADEAKAKCRPRDQEKERKAQKRRMEGEHEQQGQDMAKQQKLLEESEQKIKMAALEYACLIGVPTVANLKGNYQREKLLELVQHGGSNISRIYIPRNQNLNLNDGEIARSIVDLLATTDKPDQLIGQVTIEKELGEKPFHWPRSEQLKMKEKKPNVTVTFDEASIGQKSFSGWHLAEYELINRGCRFQVCIYYGIEDDFNIWLAKFVYRRLA